MCIDHGVDALGLVFYPPSPRFIDTDTARQIIDGLPPFITVVGLFMNADSDDVRKTLEGCRLDRLQFHGSESADYCEQFNMPYFKAISMGDGQQDFAAINEEFSSASAFLLDSHKENQAGGSGARFDWAIIPSEVNKPLILAGGLTPDNVQSAIRTVKPYAVDCSSGVEAQPGIKDPLKVRQFVENVANVSATE